MIDYNETVARAESFQDIAEAKRWVFTIISDLVDLKQSPGGGPVYHRLLNRIVTPFNGKGKGAFLKEIEGYVKEEEHKRRTETFNDATDDAQREQLDTDESGSVPATQKNIVTVSTGNKYIEFQYDTFTERQLFRFKQSPLWHEGLEKDWLEITYPVKHKETGTKINRWHYVDGHISEIKLYLHQFFPEERRWFELDAALDTVSKRNQINIYRDWMDNGLPQWDSIDRFDVLYRYAGVEDKEWSKVIAKLIFLGIVARCYIPGFDFRGNVILEGLENIGKTWFTKILPFDFRFYAPIELTKNMSDYEIARQMRSRIVIEMADKGGMDSRTYDQIKAFLTRTQDVNRRMAQNNVEDLKRLGIIIVTCNEFTGYLKGGREEDTRFYPCHCNGKINVEAIIAELPQIYAQAKHLWDIGITPRPTEDEMKLQQKYISSRQIKPAYYYYVLEYLRANRAQMVHEWDDGFTMDEMLNWMAGQDWFHTKTRQQHRNDMQKVLKPYFHIESVLKYVPKEMTYNPNAGKMMRKWRYVGEEKWISFIDNLED